MRKLLPGIAALAAALALSLWAAPRLPETVAIHWGFDGRPNGWGTRGTAIWFLPIVCLVLAGVLAVLPRLDPRQESQRLQAPTYWLVANASLVFLAFVQIASIGDNLGWPVRMANTIPVGLGLLLVVLGNAMPRMRPNWFLGIRTPWTLSSEQVWRRTHRLGGWAFVAAGGLVGVSPLLPSAWAPYLLGGGIAAAALIPAAYSYLLWRRDQEGRA